MVRIDLAVPADVRFGAGRVSEVPAALAALGASRVLVVTGRTTSRADAVRSALTEAGISSIAFRVATEPSIERVRAAVALIAEAGCDAVLGFGGGSALDVGKAVAVLATSRSRPVGPSGGHRRRPADHADRAYRASRCRLPPERVRR